MTDYFARAAFRIMNVSCFVAVLGLAAPSAAGDLSLLMFDQAGCVYCQQWEAEIGPIYPVTEEAELAPLTKIDIDAALPDGVVLTRPAAFTPTFVLLDDGQEVGRIEGYPGEDFFWFLLGELIDTVEPAGT
jgi:hypothetical protein